MSERIIVVCDFKGCEKEINDIARRGVGWVTLNGQLWCFGHESAVNIEMTFCSWEHFTASAKKGFI